MDAFPFELLNQEHQHILAEAEKKHIVIRLLGALAFDIRCPMYSELRRVFGQNPFRFGLHGDLETMGTNRRTPYRFRLFFR